MTASPATDMQQTTLHFSSEAASQEADTCPALITAKTQHLSALIIATSTAFSIYKEGPERLWVHDSQMQEKKPRILLLSGWPNTPLLHAFHM